MSYRSFRLLWTGVVVAVLLVLAGTVLSLGSPIERPSRTDHVVLLEIKNSEFNPHEFHLPQGRRSALYIVNRDLHAHTFVVDEWGLRVTIPSRRSATVLIHPGQSGEFRVYCDDARHEGSMCATLTVH